MRGAGGLFKSPLRHERVFDLEWIGARGPLRQGERLRQLSKHWGRATGADPSRWGRGGDGEVRRIRRRWCSFASGLARHIDR